MKQPLDDAQRLDACDILIENHGERAMNDLLRQHPDKEIILEAEGHFDNYCSQKHSNVSYKKIPLDSLTTTEIRDRVDAAGDKKNEGNTVAHGGPETEIEKKLKIQSGILYGLSALALLYLGSKLLN